MEVVAAIIRYENKILCMQRGRGKYSYLDFKYEFPGGKIEEGESRTEALIREIKEEMDLELDVKEKDFFMTVSYSYADFDIVLHSFICDVKGDSFIRKEHLSHKWLAPTELDLLDWADADYPIVIELKKS